MNRDFAEMLSELSEAGVDFILVGAHALAALGIPRATGGLDIWVRPTRRNAQAVMVALRQFGAPLFDLTAEDLTRSDTVFQIGQVPSRIDILSGISAVDFDDAWASRAVSRRRQRVGPLLESARQRVGCGWLDQHGRATDGNGAAGVARLPYLGSA